MKFTKKNIDRYSRQIVLKKVGLAGQKKIFNASVLIIGAGGLGSPIAIYLASLGIGKIGVIDKDKVELSNLNRQIIFNTNDINKSKSTAAISKLKVINPNISLKSFNKEITNKNIKKIAQSYNIIVDGSDNFKTRFLINDYCFKSKKILVSGAVSRFDGQVYTFNFTNKKSPCLRCFMPKMPSNYDFDNCEYEGILGTLTGIIGTIQAHEVVKEILNIGDTLCGYILVIDSLKLNFRKIKLNKRSDCICNAKNK